MQGLTVQGLKAEEV